MSSGTAGALQDKQIWRNVNKNNGSAGKSAKIREISANEIKQTVTFHF